LSLCSSSCIPAIPTNAFHGASYDGASGAVFGTGSTGTNRIYFTAKEIGKPWALYLLEKNNSAWPLIPRVVASMSDPFYSQDPNNAARPNFPEGRRIYFPRV